MNNKNRIALVVAFLLVIGTSWLLVSKKERQPKPIPPAPSVSIAPLNTRATHTLLPGAAVPTMEQVYFVSNLMLPMFDKTALTYPEPSIRERFARFLQRTRDGGDVHFNMDTGIQSQVMAAVSLHEGRITLTIWVCVPMQWYKESGEDLEALEDEMVMSMLHEQYHVEHHVLQNAPHRLAESEAWWYTIETVCLPMRKTGRLKKIKPFLARALEAYRQANGDPKSASWQNFLDELGN